MDIEKISGALGHDEDLIQKFVNNFEKVCDIQIKFKRELPENIQESVQKIRAIIDFVSDKSRFLGLSPDGLISMERELSVHLCYLSEARAYYSTDYSIKVVYRRAIKSAISLSLRKIAKNFQDVLDKKLSKGDVDDMADLGTIEEFEQESYNQYISEFLQNLNAGVNKILKIIEDRLIELRNQRRQN